MEEVMEFEELKRVQTLISIFRKDETLHIFYFFSSKCGHLLQSSVKTLAWLQFILLSQFLWLLMVVYFKTKDLQFTRFYLFLGSSSEFVNRPRTLSNAATI